MLKKLLMGRLFFIYKKHRYDILYALLSGVILTFAFAPFQYVVALPISFLSFFHIIKKNALIINHSSALKKGFFIGFAFGFGHFCSSLYWISNALLVEAEKFAWLIPFVVIIIPLVISLFTALFSMLMTYFLLCRYREIAIYLLFSSYWIIFEFIRSYAILDFPWNPTGVASIWSTYFAQIISVFGIHGTGFIMLISIMLLYSRKIVPMLFSFFLLASCIAYGYHRIHSRDGVFGPEHLIKLRIVQPNFYKPHFGNLDLQLDYLSKLVCMSNKGTLDNRELIIWPESSYPFMIDDLFLEIIENKQFDKIGLDGLNRRISIIFGADRYEKHKSNFHLFNSMIFYSNKTGKVSVYDKKILVPFGEYMPFKRFFPFVEKIATGMYDFSIGKKKNTLKLDDNNYIMPLICFEIAFDSLYHNEVYKNVLFILNITNDLWFGESIGIYQHFTMAQIRAIEYGASLVRVANTGISAFIDCYGRVLLSSDLNSAITMDCNLPLARDFSVYVNYRLKSIVLAFVCFVAAYLSMYGRINDHKIIKILLKIFNRI